MGCLGKSVVRVAVISGLALGAAVVIAGPHRVGAAARQVKERINAQIDGAITDPVALREQLRTLESEYPKRIGEVRADLAELREQKSQLERELEVSKRVVVMADDDLNKLDTQLAAAENAAIENVSYGTKVRAATIRLRNDVMTVEQGYAKKGQVTATRNAYASRAADIERDMGYLVKQESQLAGLLNKLESEHTAFQTQLFDLDRQIDSIARNDRMLDIMQKRQRTIDDQSRYSAYSLDQITSKLADIRAKQEAQMASFDAEREHFSYEDAAKLQIDREKAGAPAHPYGDDDRRVENAEPLASNN